MKIDLFSIPIHVTNIDNSKIKLISADFRKEWISNTWSSHGFKNFLTANSYNYLMETISTLLYKHLEGKTELQLLNIWENKYIKDDFQENHIHTGSHFSFVIYVSGEKSKTVFFAPHKYLIESFYSDSYGDSFYDTCYETELRPGQIVVFPSFLEHMVIKNSGNVTYSGNLKMIRHEKKEIIYKKELPNKEVT